MTTPAQRWSLLLTLASGLLLIALDNSILYTALPTLSRELDASAGQSLWIINAYPLVMAGLLLGAGTLGDRLGHRRMFLAGLWIFGLASLAAAFAPNANALIAARAALAVGAAAMMPATLALIRLVFTDERERNLAIAIWGSVALIGAALGPMLGGLLLQQFWWGAVFLVNVPVVVIALVATHLLAPAPVADSRRHWDALSSLLALVALSGLVLGIKALASTPIHSMQAAGGWISFVIAAWLFARRQRQLPYPLLDFALFRNPAFTSGVLAAAFTMFAIGGLQLVTTQRFQLVADFTPMQAGMLVSLLALGALPAAIGGGAILHRVGLRPLLSGGLAAAALGTFIVATTVQWPLAWIIVGSLITGVGLGATISVASVAIVGNAPDHRAGMASAVEEVSYELGALLAVALLGSLIAALYSMTVVLPPGTPETASRSLIDALTIADARADTALRAAATAAYDHGYRIVGLIAAIALVIASLVTALLLRAPTLRQPGVGSERPDAIPSRS